uniref:tRNA-uridine aminocarboxypropyltransferase 1 n=1 Tax=Knipowitschia caucasica TaxID=637954 RepID=A0AAV2LTV1_KNICA
MGRRRGSWQEAGLSQGPEVEQEDGWGVSCDGGGGPGSQGGSRGGARKPQASPRRLRQTTAHTAAQGKAGANLQLIRECLLCLTPNIGLSTLFFEKGMIMNVGELAKRPLQDLKLASHQVLEQAQEKGRLKCDKCGGSRMFFCYTCCCLVGVSPQNVPLLKLPVKIDIIKHPNETDGKSTAIHAKILAPDDVTIYTYPCIPEYDQDQVVLVFPGPKAVAVHNMIQSLRERAQDPSAEPRRKRLRAASLSDCPTHGEGDRGAGQTKALPLRKVVFIDSTWNQTNKISTDERLQGLVKLK